MSQTGLKVVDKEAKRIVMGTKEATNHMDSHVMSRDKEDCNLDKCHKLV